MEGRRRWRSCVKGHAAALLVILINEDLDAEGGLVHSRQLQALGLCSSCDSLPLSCLPCFFHLIAHLSRKTLSPVGTMLLEHSGNDLNGEESGVETRCSGSFVVFPSADCCSICRVMKETTSSSSSSRRRRCCWCPLMKRCEGSRE